MTPWHIRDAGVYALEKGFTKYTSNAGLVGLRQEIARYMRRLRPTPFRIDVVEVFGDASRGAPDRVLHFRNAVPLETRFVHQGLRR